MCQALLLILEIKKPLEKSKGFFRLLPAVDDYRTFLTSSEGYDLLKMIERFAA